MKQSPSDGWSHDLLEQPHGVPDKPARIKRMFNAIAPRYELVNSLCSAGRDAYWRRRAVELSGARAADDVLDVACGTGDFTRAFLGAGVRFAVGCDFAHEMLRRARAPKTGLHGPRWVEADAADLPFQDERFSVASCAFGIRNFGDLSRGLGEMHRVLRAGGRAVVLEFTRPSRTVVRAMYEFYAQRIMPLAATLVSGDRGGAYRYLPRSIVSFPSTSELVREFLRAGFARCDATPLTLGVVTVYLATRDRS